MPLVAGYSLFGVEPLLGMCVSVVFRGDLSHGALKEVVL